MKRLRFDELLLVSQAERRALRLPFHASSTVIKGANDTGKSSVVKSLYATLGAVPEDVHPKWKSLGVMSSLRFRIDDEAFRMVRSDTRFSLFDAEDKLIGSYTSVTRELAPKFAEMFAFRLHLRQNNSGTEENQATPAFLFMPFYIDQDAGWRTDWMTSFAGRKQFRYTRPDVLKFHFGIRPSEWYLAKLRQSEAESKAAEIRHEHATLERVLESLLKELQVADFSLDLEAFKEEVIRLLERCNRLRADEEKLRARLSDAYRHLSAIREQVSIANHALDELRADREFSATLGDDTVRCPTCHAEYANGFAERFDIAVDEDGCLELLAELDEQKRKAERDFNEAKTTTQAAMERVAEVQQLLDARQEELVLQDLLRSEGRREMLGVVKRQLSDLLERLGGVEVAIAQAKERKKKYEDKKRDKQIRDYNRSEITRLFQRLDVRNIPADSYKNLGARIHETGSDVPRAVLGVFLAGLRTIERHSTSTLCPAVIDSPKQQDQDDASWKLICETIRDERPADSQLILAGADDGDTDFGGEVVELTRKRQVLDTEEYREVWDEIFPLYELGIRADEERK